MNWRSYKRSSPAPAATAIPVGLPAVVAVALVLGAAVCAPVSAENATPTEAAAREHPTAAPKPSPGAGPRPFGLSIGAGAGYVPVAKGVNAWEPLLMPHVEAQLGRRVVLGTGGLAVRVLGVPGEGASGAAAGAAGGPTGDGAGATNGSPRVRLTALLLPNFGRYDEHLPADYDGIGDVPATGEAGLDVGVRLWKGLEATARLAADALGRGHRGSYAAVGVRWRGAFPRADPDGGGGISRARLQCALGADVVAGTRHYMEAYYGVSETQARRTAFDTYDAAAGLEAARAHVTLALPLGPRVIVASETTAMLLVGTARRSPLVRSPEQGATRFIVTYRL